MPHAVTYHADGDVLLLGDGSPGVAGTVHRYFHRHADAPGELLQCLVHPTLAVVILFPDIGKYVLVYATLSSLPVFFLLYISCPSLMLPFSRKAISTNDMPRV